MFSYIALVSQTNQVPNWEVQMAAAALQIQVNRDFTPIWGIDATISAFDQLADVPTGFWPIIIRNDIGFPGAAGIHLDENKKPFGLVQASNRWTLTASHEILETLADPMGNRTISAESIKAGQGFVEYLVEVCDPSEDDDFSYQINGVIVSDFYTPDFFLPRQSGNVRYSFSGSISKPRSILRGGYISWFHPQMSHWWQQTWFSGSNPQFRDLGVLDTSKVSPRTAIDTATMKYRKRPPSIYGLPKNQKLLVAQRELFSIANAENLERAKGWDKRINQIKRAAKA